MSIVLEVARELVGMFVVDARLTAAIFMLAAVAAALVDLLHVPPLAAGAVLTIGCIAILVEAAIREAKRRKS